MQSLVVHIISMFHFNVFCIVVALDGLKYFILKIFCTNPLILGGQFPLNVAQVSSDWFSCAICSSSVISFG